MGVNEIRALISHKRACFLPLLFALWGYDEQYHYTGCKRGFIRTQPCCTLMLDFQPPQLWEINFCYLWDIQPLVFLLCAVCSDGQSCLTLWDPMDYKPPDSSVHEISQARILVWGAISSSRGSSWPRDRSWITYISCTSGQILYH